MKIKFIPQNKEVQLQSDKSILDIANEEGLFIASSCNGQGTCADCRVRVQEGEANVLGPTKSELQLLGDGAYLLDQRRLACQLYCYGDVTIDLHEQLERFEQKGISKKFLEKINKSSDQVRSVDDIFVQQDEDMKKIKDEN